MKKMKLTFSARLNDDGSWRGIAWAEKKISPILIVGLRTGEYFTRKEAIQAAKKAGDCLTRNPTESK